MKKISFEKNAFTKPAKQNDELQCQENKNFARQA